MLARAMVIGYLKGGGFDEIHRLCFVSPMMNIEANMSNERRSNLESLLRCERRRGLAVIRVRGIGQHLMELLATGLASNLVKRRLEEQPTR